MEEKKKVVVAFSGGLDTSLTVMYLATMDITKKWTGHRQDWGQIHSQLEIYFEERLAGRNL